MDINIRNKEGVVILGLVGRIDADCANLVETVGQCVHSGCSDILCNFSEVDYIDYVGISAIVIAYKEVVNHNARMKFCNISAHLREMFAISGLDRTIEILADEDTAVISFREDKVIEDIKRMQLRRRFKRLPVDIKVELKNDYEATFRSYCLKAEIVNLSAIGAYIFGCDKFKLGDEVVVKLILPPGSNTLELHAKVVWLPDKQVQPHFYPGIGVEFTHLAGPVQQKLLEFIERNLSFHDS